MAICKVCLEAIKRLRPQDRLSRDAELKVEATLPRRTSSAADDCWLCAKLANWLDAVDTKALSNWHAHQLQVEYSGVGGIGFTNTREGVAFYMSIRPPSVDDYDGCVISLALMPSNGKSSTSHTKISWLMTTALGHTTLSSKRLSRLSDDLATAKGWFEKCKSEHKGCQNNGLSWFPTRLLDIGTRGKHVRLIVTAKDPPTGPYMTLSHRWSSARYTMLESSTMAQLQKRVDVLPLPASFQDAIRVARYLGVNYIWIDSLCIKQDKNDPSDWAVESRKMSQVYSHACLNISATRSVDGTESLLGQSCWAVKHPTRIELMDANGSLCEYDIVDGELWDDEVELANLTSRGWVFQERYLARRILHFGDTQLGWECREHRALDMFPQGLPVSLGVPKGKLRDMASGTAATSSSLLDSKFAENWSYLMNQYSQCEFTFAKDKLVALEGIATDTMVARKHDTYAAGMWKSSALFDLAWWRDDHDRKRYSAATTAKRAPSWSWAGFDGEVNFPTLNSGFSRLHETYATVKKMGSQTKITKNAVVTKGTLVFEGLLLQMTLGSKDEEPTAFTVQDLSFTAGDETLASSIYLDPPAEVGQAIPQGRSLFFTPLFSTIHSLFGLILTPAKGTGEYYRLGTVEIPIMDQGTPGAGEERDAFLAARVKVPSNFQGSRLEDVSKLWSKQALKLTQRLRQSRSNLAECTTVKVI